MSTLKVGTINTPNGSGNITFSRPTVLQAGDIVEADIADNAITLAKMAGGTDGNIISYDASGDPVAVATGSSGQVLTSAGAGAPPTFAAAAAGGKLVQLVYFQTGAVSTGTTQIPADDTIPQNTEGVEKMSLAITPTNASNILVIQMQAQLITTSTTSMSAAIFQDSTAGALASVITYQATTNVNQAMDVNHHMVAGTTSATTFKLRVGTSGAVTTTFNGYSDGSRLHGGVMASFIRIMEIAA